MPIERLGFGRAVLRLFDRFGKFLGALEAVVRIAGQRFGQQGIEFRPKFQLDQVGTIASFVKQGLGIAVLPYLGIAPLLSLKGMSLSTVVDGPVRSIGIVRRRNSSVTPLAQLAMEGVRSVSRRLIADPQGRVLAPSEARPAAA